MTPLLLTHTGIRILLNGSLKYFKSFFSVKDNACPKDYPVPYSNRNYCCKPVDSSTTQDEIDNGTLMIHNSNV